MESQTQQQWLRYQRTMLISCVTLHQIYPYRFINVTTKGIVLVQQMYFCVISQYLSSR